MSKVFYQSGTRKMNGVNYERGWYYEVDGIVWGIKSDTIYRSGYRTERLAQIGLRNHLKQMHWSSIWHRALINMPYRISLVGPEVAWTPLLKGKTPVGDLIKGLAKRYYQYDGVGDLCEVIRTYRVKRFGMQYCLTRIMLFTSVRSIYAPPEPGEYSGKKIGTKKVIAHNTVFNDMRRGSAPKEKWRRELLERLAQDDGRQVAAQLLKQQGFDLDRYNYIY